MKIDMLEENTLGDEFKIEDTKDFNAKRLLSLFVANWLPLYELLDNSPATRALKKLASDYFELTKDLDINTLVHDLPSEVVSCFLRFMEACPNIHITID